MLQRSTPRLILASASTSRRDLLRAAGLSFEIRPADINEGSIKAAARSCGLNAEQTALRLAVTKAGKIAEKEPDALVIGADQILVYEDVWFDKPADMDAARAQLMALRGRPHELATAVACVRGGECLWQHAESPCLVMRCFSEEFLDTYISEEGPALTTSVGCYRLEGIGVNLMEDVEGSHSSVLGLPLLPLLAFLRSQGAIVS